MVYGLLIIGTYLCGVLAIHLAYSWMNPQHTEAEYYVLYTYNNQLQIEWIIRSLIVFYWLQGKSISITIIDEGSSDDTFAILSILSQQHQLDVRLADDDSLQQLPSRDTSIHIRLSKPEDLQKLPQVSTLW
jgi:hypothetical protein